MAILILSFSLVLFTWKYSVIMLNKIPRNIPKRPEKSTVWVFFGRDLWRGTSGGSITITSLGGIGGSFFTPIINYPEVAILGIGRTYFKQVFIKEKFEKRIMLPISLSYDHRIIDGAEAARFCNEIKENLGKDFAYKLAV